MPDAGPLHRLVLGAALTAAMAAPMTVALTDTRAQAAPAPPAAARALVAALGERTVGSYLDGGRNVVTVTDEAGEQQVRAAGLVARRVDRSGRQLAAARTRLEATAGIPGTAWAVDPVTATVAVSYDDTVTGSRREQLAAATAPLGDSVRIEHVAGRFAPTAAGGDAIYGGPYRCSLGFNVRSGSTYYFLTAGHCGNIAGTWYSDARHVKALGSVVASSFPGDDYALVRYEPGARHPGRVDLYGGNQDIVSAEPAVVGQSVRRSGSTTHVHSGTVTAVDATVNYAEGSVRGLVRTTVCAEPGDSGGALFAGTVALGLTSGGSGDCSSGGTTFFQPVDEALARFAVGVY